MRTAVDANVISAVWSSEPSAAAIATLLARSHRAGSLTIAAPVYAELLAYPGASIDFVDAFLASTRISVDFRLDEAVWREAGSCFARHAARRRASGSGAPRRILADFLIGAHALFHADRLLTRDISLFEQDFPGLKIVTCD